MKSNFGRVIAGIAVVCGMLGMADKASASLIYLGTVDAAGTGLGNVNTLMTFKPEGSGTVACGTLTNTSLIDCNGSTDFPGINQARTFAEMGWTTATDVDSFRLVFNIAEPGSDNALTLNELSATFYFAGGGSFTADYAGDPTLPWNMPQIGDGSGIAGYVFGLDAEQAAIVAASFDTANSIGVHAAVSDASGRHETFFVATGNASTPDTPTPVPEPASMVLFGLGLIAVSRRAMRSRSRHA